MAVVTVGTFSYTHTLFCSAHMFDFTDTDTASHLYMSLHFFLFCDLNTNIAHM